MQIIILLFINRLKIAKNKEIDITLIAKIEIFILPT